jgi:hypothetical protein
MANRGSRTSNLASRWDGRVLFAGLSLVAALATAGTLLIPSAEVQAQAKSAAPELVGGTGWLGTDRPLLLKDLRGKIVILEFWTEC